MDRFCLLTKTYRGDFEAFERLCESIDQHMPDVPHYVLVDHGDADLFARFKSAKRTVTDCKDVLPGFREFQLMGRRFWWRKPNKLVRGWIFQQLAKIRFAGTLDFEAVVIVDSDAIFLRRLLEDDLFIGGKVKLYHRRDAPSGGAQSARWHNAALQAFGRPQTGYTGYDYVSTAVAWSPDVVRDMIATIEQAHNAHWFDVLLRNFRFSEYVTYGVFCDQIAGPHRDLVEPTHIELSHCSWHYDLDSDNGLEQFRRDLQPHHAAVLLQSNLGLDTATRREIFGGFGQVGRE